MIVADAGPVIACARIGRLTLLQQVIGTLVVPDAVYDDLVVKGHGKPGADEIDQSTWMRRQAVQDRDAVAHFPPVLAQGEREAIVLAGELDATLLMDDHRAREAAEERGIKVVGVLWVLGEAKRRGFVTEVRPIIDELLAMGVPVAPGACHPAVPSRDGGRPVTRGIAPCMPYPVRGEGSLYALPCERGRQFVPWVEDLGLFFIDGRRAGMPDAPPMGHRRALAPPGGRRQVDIGPFIGSWSRRNWER